MLDPIKLKETYYIRSRPDVLFRLVNEPKRRVKWDRNLRSMTYVGEERLVGGAVVKIRLPARLAGMSFQARYTQLQAPSRSTLESLRGFGPIERYLQQWSFKPIPGGTEITASLTVNPRFNFMRRPLERLLRNMLIQTLVDLQRQVDAGGAEAMLESAREAAKEARKRRKPGKDAKDAKSTAAGPKRSK
ncbi:hypothetical protein HNR42_000542 [Deinobacterium chartae]|uniref:Polyketide cyclase / dehydrase and lipid transport n=1 Tax=Deinobacterium chartae TaxID=521158 RepID=A0A841HYV1_9DEIO|nr:SRPBCC family protein [Deinobacterium chartae]MBB6097128.1 hypothetical protein [Deinobacterium chartae]